MIHYFQSPTQEETKMKQLVSLSGTSLCHPHSIPPHRYLHLSRLDSSLSPLKTSSNSMVMGPLTET